MEISKKRLVEIINEEIVSMAELAPADADPTAGVSAEYTAAMSALEALTPEERATIAAHLAPPS